VIGFAILCCPRSRWNRFGLPWIHALNQSIQHAPDLMETQVRCLMLLFCEQPKVAGQQKQILKLTCGTSRDMEKLTKLGPAPSGTSLCDVGRYRRCRSSHLTREAISLVIRKNRGCGIDAQDQRVTFLPNLELLEILHAARASFFSVYLQLMTNNCQLIGAAHA